MEKKRKCVIIAIFIILSLYLSTVVAVAEDPTMIVDPEKPARKSSVTFTAEFPDDIAQDILSVILAYNECSDVCYSKKEETMTPIGDNSYEATINLEKDDATYVQYWLEVETEEGTTEYLKETKVYLSTESTGSNSDSNGSPGFELILLLLSIVMAMFIFTRKRDK